MPEIVGIVNRRDFGLCAAAKRMVKLLDKGGQGNSRILCRGGLRMSPPKVGYEELVAGLFALSRETGEARSILISGTSPIPA